MLTRKLGMIAVLIGFIIVSPSETKRAIAQNEGLNLLSQLENAFVAISDRVKPAVVNISATSSSTGKHGSEGPRRKHPNSSGSGTGIIMDGRGYIVTNNHVVGNADNVEVRLSDKRRFTGKVIGKDPDTDLAVIKVDSEESLPVVTWGDSSDVKVGQWVIAVGNPYGLDRTVTVGIISGIGRENVQLSRYENFIQTDASINPGNSGGPLFNIRGEVIGINTAIINFAQGIGFAIPSNMAQNIVDQLILNGKVVRGWLGVGIQAVTQDLATKFGVTEGQGVLINDVFEGDPADKAGLQPGDIIIKVNGSNVDTPQTLSRLIAGLGPTNKARLVVVRDGKEKTLTVVLGERKEEAMVASIPPLPETLFGLTVEDLTVELSERFKLKENKGALITKVEPGSIAETQGLKEGDLLREVNRNEINTAKDFKDAITELKEGESVLVRVIRENRALYILLKTEDQ